jgi:hypothetical protein
MTLERDLLKKPNGKIIFSFDELFKVFKKKIEIKSLILLKMLINQLIN